MIDKKILKLLEGYEKKLIVLNKESDNFWNSLGYAPELRLESKLKHALEMIPKMRTFLVEGHREKAFRWLGFLQCVFWMEDVYTIEELANHSRSSKQSFRDIYSKHSLSLPNCAVCGWEVCDFKKEYEEAPENELPIL